MSKFGKAIIVLFVALLVILKLSFSNSNKSFELNQCNSTLNDLVEQNSGLLLSVDSLTTTLSGLQATGTDEATGTIPEEVSTTLNFPNQPTTAVGTYEGNTQALNLYSSKTSQTATIDKSYKGEIIIHLRKSPTIHTVVYFKTNRIYCGGRLNEPINDNNDFILSMDGFKVGKNNCVLKNTDGTLPEEIRVGGYVANFEGNGIETVTFK